MTAWEEFAEHIRAMRDIVRNQKSQLDLCESCDADVRDFVMQQQRELRQLQEETKQLRLAMSRKARVSQRAVYFRSYYLKHKQELNAKSRAYFHNNRDKANAYQREYRKKNREHIRRYRREYWWQHREELLPRRREQYRKKKAQQEGSEK